MCSGCKTQGHFVPWYFLKWIRHIHTFFRWMFCFRRQILWPIGQDKASLRIIWKQTCEGWSLFWKKCQKNFCQYWKTECNLTKYWYSRFTLQLQCFDCLSRCSRWEHRELGMRVWELCNNNNKKCFCLGRTQIWWIQFLKKPQTISLCVFKLVSEIDLYVSFCVFMGNLVLKQVLKFNILIIMAGKRTLLTMPNQCIYLRSSLVRLGLVW